ncbi:transglutaminase-like domain-containing protein [Streptomyces sp. GbtcB7]|uniref:transglutaminase-like domain-containing protein n=1 Tax=Streptomyces sp. GbtcB7 TaxID=2824752 RepID=UPI001C3022A4|nr:transglutaminase-like domain-containing protein [Streptomyces sp. GbtcB7]
MDQYLKQTPYSDPGDALDLGGLPRDPGQLARVVRDLIIHRGEGPRFAYAIPEERVHEDAESRYAARLLRILAERGDAPLTERRAPAERFVGTCRDFALLHCSLLRATGTAARLRCGFARYFDAYYADHWVTEYRLPDGSWRLADPQVHHEYDIDFDPMDVPRDQFLVATDAWRACREGGADPRRFGVLDLNGIEGLSYHGLWFVRADVLRDLAALNGVELLPWDAWGPEILDDAALDADELALIDSVAAAGGEDELRRLYRDPRLTVPDEIVSYTTYGGVRKVTLGRT